MFHMNYFCRSCGFGMFVWHKPKEACDTLQSDLCHPIACLHRCPSRFFISAIEMSPECTMSESCLIALLTITANGDSQAASVKLCHIVQSAPGRLTAYLRVFITYSPNGVSLDPECFPSRYLTLVSSRQVRIVLEVTS
ncbi:hypothetical protein SCLCIDRAFT_953682 [Scleroderma citrinum Foug A]|uniref:Uncharacterized protein n=1 Tax=Scleroderma citrinum Foug A TaxID=1036808 RepID=A0A0C3EKJ9_9AGAM|nr:hypothetical protein SCLCIDRAFT_953682 [Scleroderma citrinum Foug A]